MDTRSRKMIINEAKALLNSYGIRSRIHFNNGECYSQISEGFVSIGLNSPEFVDRDTILSAVFHEIAHVVNYRNRKYYPYHNDKVLNKRTLAYAKRFGLKAEQHTDFVGSKMMKKYDPSLCFRFTYTKMHMKERYRKEFLPLLESFLGL